MELNSENHISANMRLKDVMHSLLDVAIFLLEGEAGSILLLDESRQYLQLRFAKGYGSSSDLTFALGEGVAGWVALRGQSVAVPLTSLDSRYEKRKSPLVSGQDVLSVICAPIFIEQQIAGVVCVDSAYRHFDNCHLSIIEPIANQMGQALAKEREIPNHLLKDYMELTDQPHYTSCNLEELNPGNSKEDLALVFLNTVQGLFKQCDSGFFVLEDEDIQGNYQVITSFGQLPRDLYKPCSKFPYCKTLATKQAILFNNGFHCLEEECLFKDYKAQSVMFVPLIAQGVIRGILVVGSAFPNAFKEKELKSLQIFAGQLSLLYRVGISYSHLQHYTDYIVNSVAVGVLCTDLSGRITLVNKIAQNILGVEASRLVGREYGEFAKYLELKDFEEATRRLITTGEQVDDIHVGLHYPVGQRKKTLEVNLNLLRNSSGVAIGMIVSFEDISSKLMLEEQLRRAERLLMAGQLAAGAAHEIKNPLTTIKGFAQLLKSTLPEEDRRVGYLDTVLGEAEQINRILQEMDELAKVKLNHLDWVDMPRLIEEVLDEKRQRGGLASITVHTSCQGAISPVFGDKVSLKKVLWNLISNSIEAMDEQGSLNVEVNGTDGTEIEVIIGDTGVGISEEEKEKVFNPFYTKRPEATGLGLSISYKTIRDHGGTMFIESQIGKGTKVTIKLPINFSFGDILQQ